MNPTLSSEYLAKGQMMTVSTQGQPSDMTRLNRVLGPLLLYSFVTNLVILVSPIFMMQVLDRVVPSGNTGTLLLLLAIALGALVLNGVIEFGRDRSLARISRWIEDLCLGPIFQEPREHRATSLEALQRVRGFVGGNSLVAVLSLVWIPLFGIALALIHPAYVVLVLGVVALIAFIRFLEGSLTRDRIALSGSLAETERKLGRQLEAAGSGVCSSAPIKHLTDKLLASRRSRLALEDQADGPRQGAAAIGSTLRMASQLLALSLGAYLVSKDLMSAGGMIAASIISSKSISTLEHSFSALKEWPHARSAFNALNRLRNVAEPGINIDSFSGELSCEGLIYPRGAGAPPRLDRIGFTVAAGECVAIIGDSGSGKTTLLAALAGLSPCPIGTAKLDQSDVRHLSPAAKKKAIGYVPQIAGILPGTVAENISGFDPNAKDEAIIAAAKLAKIHGLISGLSDGYMADLSSEPFLLTAGQKQQLALATALYARPKYLFMDEPNALFDRHSERLFSSTLEELKALGMTVVMVLHRTGVIGMVDKVIVMDRGRMSDFGPRSQVLGRRSEGVRITRFPLKLSSVQDLADWIASQFVRNHDAPFASKAALLTTEMFHAALLNGRQTERREMQVEFKFLNDRNCEIQMIERGPTGAETLLPRILAALDKGEAAQDEMTPAERPLMVAARLATRISVSNGDDMSKFWARLEVDDASLMKGTAN